MKKYILQKSPFIVPSNDGKLIEEHFGNIVNDNPKLSIAHMVAPSGWSEPFQTPSFDEYTYIIKGKKQFIVDGDTLILNVGESIKDARNKLKLFPCKYLARLLSFVCRESRATRAGRALSET